MATDPEPNLHVGIDWKMGRQKRLTKQPGQVFETAFCQKERQTKQIGHLTLVVGGRHVYRIAFDKSVIMA